MPKKSNNKSTDQMKNKEAEIKMLDDMIAKKAKKLSVLEKKITDAEANIKDKHDNTNNIINRFKFINELLGSIMLFYKNETSEENFDGGATGPYVGRIFKDMFMIKDNDSDPQLVKDKFGSAFEGDPQLVKDKFGSAFEGDKDINNDMEMIIYLQNHEDDVEYDNEIDNILVNNMYSTIKTYMNVYPMFADKKELRPLVFNGYEIKNIKKYDHKLYINKTTCIEMEMYNGENTLCVKIINNLPDAGWPYLNINSIKINTEGIIFDRNYFETINELQNKIIRLSISIHCIESLSALNIVFLMTQIFEMKERGYKVMDCNGLLPFVTMEEKETCHITSCEPPYIIFELVCTHKISVMAFIGMIINNNDLNCPMCRHPIVIKTQNILQDNNKSLNFDVSNIFPENTDQINNSLKQSKIDKILSDSSYKYIEAILNDNKHSECAADNNQQDDDDEECECDECRETHKHVNDDDDDDEDE
ncbi:MAG: hypothetical protein Edafosvirus3_16 [Edafosvirus sp.]|uniref:Uncharacterized protein n=1 Tax=Edafosvirus sp. TaxID=2487765 RepID=A0A3G4ZSS0_9VIRU|nr:MAG: hypothetical protein Edafosvirus3_16 [Edafosvirus sp.]